ncbi:hypothetical protein [Natronococcus sp. A-GB7]|uniref:hypothetical protein n=1 Tax=Natronococcus sp. A-GB7 TaxID=3037649 RepID=UPI00241F1626|nr:hypothetical protein [Natronococcus sp. A-GB7]MDG5820863.1 hypothetical protein [Natronococcus sp. A-GB7]
MIELPSLSVLLIGSGAYLVAVAAVLRSLGRTRTPRWRTERSSEGPVENEVSP